MVSSAAGVAGWVATAASRALAPAASARIILVFRAAWGTSCTCSPIPSPKYSIRYCTARGKRKSAHIAAAPSAVANGICCIVEEVPLICPGGRRYSSPCNAPPGPPVKGTDAMRTGGLPPGADCASDDPLRAAGLRAFQLILESFGPSAARLYVRWLENAYRRKLPAHRPDSRQRHLHGTRH